MNPSLEQRVEILERIVREFSSAPEMSPEMKSAINAIVALPSSKTAASATQAVNEAGTSTYSVMTPPTGFISISGKNIPYID